MARTKRTRRRRPAAGRPASPSTAPDDGVGPRRDDGALAVTHWFDPGAQEAPQPARVRFKGRQLGGTARAVEHFTRDEVIEPLPAGSGPIAVTTFLEGLAPGDWEVTAELVAEQRSNSRASAATLPRAAWSWRGWKLRQAQFLPIRTRPAPLHRFSAMPAVVHGSWTALVALGVFIGVVVQVAILQAIGTGSRGVLLVDGLALVSGLLAAKLWYIGLRPAQWWQRLAEGWSVDGLLVAAPLVAIVSLLTLHIPVGAFLDASTPGLYFGVTIGRFGCFLTGCCAGRITGSRWGIWSSDRRIGARRIPTQLMESATGLAIGLTSIALIRLRAGTVDGAVFVAALAAYIVVRQFLLELRAERRAPSRAVPATVAAGILVLALEAAAALGGAL